MRQLLDGIAPWRVRVWGRTGALLLAVAGLLAGCVATQPLMAPDSQVKIHVWRPITVQPNEAWQGPRTLVYTYVLVGDMEQGLPPERDTGRKRLARLLSLVQSGVEVSASESDRQVLARANQYCIPAGKLTGGRIDVDGYNHQLAKRYTNQLKVATEGMPPLAGILARPGPFLVALRRPLSEVPRDPGGQFSRVPDAAVLVMDLSDVSEAVMPEYEAAFRAAIKQGVVNTAAVDPFLPWLANQLKLLNDGVPLVAEAYLGVLKTMGVGKK